MISDNPSFSALAPLQPSQLFSFQVKLLKLPTEAGHLSHGLCVVEREVFLVNAIGQHIQEMIEFTFSVSVRVINPIVDDPKLIDFWVDI